jgi:lysophospholipase L1-like esterase
MKRTLRWAIACLFLVVSQLVLAGSVYLSLGDSLAFGYQPGMLTPSYGIQGYVSTFAGGYPGGFSQVINLGVPAETTTTFNTGGAIGTLLNLNYLGGGTQASLMQSTIAAQEAAGNTIGVVSLMLGADDLLNVNTSGLTIAQVESAYDVTNALASLNIQSIVQNLAALAPGAKILINQYYNPYDILAANDPMRIESDYGINELNTNLAAIAWQYHATVVNFGAVINGNIGLYTHMGDASPDIHLSNLGYQTAGQLMLQAVPEPNPALALLPALGLLLVRRKR